MVCVYPGHLQDATAVYQVFFCMIRDAMVR